MFYSVLIQFSVSQSHPLEVLQNEAIRIILGCPKMTRIEALRVELHSPSIVCKVREITRHLRKVLTASVAKAFLGLVQFTPVHSRCVSVDIHTLP